ncbi:MAG TPA: hypothetical protein VN958_13125 [Chitinophagaceae bacterium]|nr:hypothetical protein [Chitinophagaceae bacterium]
MKKQLDKTTGAIALFFAGIFVLNLIACKKETVMSSANQDQLKAATVQTNAASNYISNEEVLIDLLVFIPCANGGAGEDVQLSGYLHSITKVTINGNSVHAKVHDQPQGISGTGTITGDKYQGTGVTQHEFKGSLVNGQYEETYVNNFRIIGQNNGNNFLIHATFHVTVNANGVVTSYVDHATTECK